MEILFTGQFEEAYATLSAVEKQSVRKALIRLGDDPRYPGLRVKKMEGRKSIWEARSSRKLPITFEMRGELLVLRNVGEHDRVLKNP